MKASDFKEFEKPIKIELGKVDFFARGQRHNRVVLEFNLYTGKGTHRKAGEEYCTLNYTIYKANSNNSWLTTDMPIGTLDALISLGLNPLYRDYIELLRKTYKKNGLKYTRLLPITDVAVMIDCIKMIKKIAAKEYKHIKYWK